jgi:hypothetical protein
MIAFLLAAAVAASTPCTTPKPGDGWACIGGGWLPPGHPGIPPPVVAPPPAPVPPQGTQAPLVPAFKVGKTYRRDASGALIFVLGMGVASNGVAVLATECLNEAVHDQCFFPGQGRILVANASPNGWTEQP